MKSGFRRAIATFSLVALFAVVAAAPANAADAPTGVGGARGLLDLVTVELGTPSSGSIAGIVNETNGVSIDPTLHPPGAGESINALEVHSNAVAALNGLSTTPVQTATTGAQDQKTTQTFDLGTLTSAVPGVLSGTVTPATLSSILDDQGARASLNSTLTDLSVLLGTLGVHSSAINVSGDASPTGSTAGRTAQLDGLSALNFEGLLNLLGFSTTNLSPDALAALIDKTGLLQTVATATGLDLTNAGDLGAAITALQAAAISGGSLITDLCNGLLDGVLSACTGAPTTTDIQTELDSVLGVVKDTLGGTTLVSIGQIKAAAGATAKDTIANSATAITGTISSIQIAGLAPIGPIDVTQTAAQIKALVDQANGSLSNILSTIDPSLANLVTLKVFDQSQNVFVEGDYVKAFANITALALAITPPDLCTLFDNLGVNQSLLQVNNLSAGGVQPSIVSVPTIDGLLKSLNLSVLCQVPIAASAPGDSLAPQATTVPLVTDALTEPLTFKAASINSAAEFKVVAAPVTPVTPATPALPRTGMNETLLLIVGGLMAAVALGLRRAAQPVKVRANRKP